MDHMAPVRVQQVGGSRFARHILRDGLGQFWTGSGWTDCAQRGCSLLPPR